MQKGLMEGQRLLLEQSRPEAEKILSILAMIVPIAAIYLLKMQLCIPIQERSMIIMVIILAAIPKLSKQLILNTIQQVRLQQIVLAVPVSSQVVTDETLGNDR